MHPSPPSLSLSLARSLARTDRAADRSEPRPPHHTPLHGSIMSALSDALGALIESNASLADADAAIRFCGTLLSNVASDRAGKSSIKAASKGLQSKLTRLNGGKDALEALGFVMEGENYQFSVAVDDAAVALRGQHVSAALTRMGVLKAAIEAVGDVNAPAAAREALKIVTVYLSNAAADPAGKGRISASNKALQSRLLAAQGGRELLQACGFELNEADAAWVFVETDPGGAKQLLGTLGKAEHIWRELAASRGDDALGFGDDALGAKAAGSGAGGGAAGAEDDVPAAPITSIELKALPEAAALAARAGGADLEPALVRAAGGSPSEPIVELHVWLAVSRRWQRVGSMTTPSSSFVWALPEGNGGGKIVLEVDFGDARGTGKAAPLTCLVDASGKPENEYVAAQRFISENFETIDNNYLEPIAKKLRERVDPVLATIANLRAAVEAAF